jgi:nicotinamidase-related amidase
MPLLTASSSLLLVVDLQERLMPAITGAEAVLGNTDRLIRGAVRLGVGVRATEQDPDKLGPTVEPVAAILPTEPHHKSSFAADHRALRLDPGTVVVAGCEAHVCVLQTVLALRAARYEVALVADAVGSRAPADRDRALDRMREHGVDLVSTEMVLFEWLATSRNPAFREVQKLIK